MGADSETVVSGPAVLTSMEEVAGRFWAGLVSVEVPTGFLAWVDAARSVSGCVLWCVEGETLLLVVVAVWCTKRVVWLTVPGSPLLILGEGLDLSTHQGHRG